MSVQGIHDISLILGIEASRDLEEETFSGVCSDPYRRFAQRAGIDGTSLHLANANRALHGFRDQAQDRAYAGVAGRDGHDGCAAESVPVRFLCGARSRLAGAYRE